MTSGQINYPAPLPKGPADARLAKLLVPAPYVVPEKKATKKATGTRKSARRQEVSDSSPDGLRHIPPVKMRRKKKRPLPLQREERRKGRPPSLGRPEGPRRGKPFLRTTPPTPTAERSGSPGPSPWQNCKYPDTRVIHSIRLLHSFPLRRICLCSPPKDRLDASSSGSLDSSDVNSLPDRKSVV